VSSFSLISRAGTLAAFAISVTSLETMDTLQCFPNSRLTDFILITQKPFAESEGFKDWLKSKSFDGHLKPALVSCLDYMTKGGVQKVGLLGFSWGGWVATNVVASDIATQFCCAALIHPNFDLEGRIYGGNVIELISKVSRPVLLLATKDDPQCNLDYIKLLQYKLPSCELLNYGNMKEGFLIRGVVDYEDVRFACNRAMKDITTFFERQFLLAPKDFIPEVYEFGPEAIRKDKLQQKDMEKRAATGERPKDVFDRYNEGVQEGNEQVKDRTKEVAQGSTQKSADQIERNKQIPEKVAP